MALEKDIFTAGLERGAPTSEFEVRMLVCWLLSELASPVTLTQLNAGLQQEGLVNYFELARAVARLLASKHLLETERPQGEGEHPFTVTGLGAEAAKEFERDLPLSVREKALKAMREGLLRERFKRENRAVIREAERGFRLELTMLDRGDSLLDLALYVPTRGLCEDIERRFLEDPTVLYRTVVAVLTGERLDEVLPRV